RNYFEAQLIKNLKDQLNAFSPSSFEFVKKISGAILVKLNKKGLENFKEIENALTHTFGIVNYAFASSIEQDLEKIKSFYWDLIKEKDFKTFRVTCQRSNKEFPMNSAEIEREIGGFIFEKFERKKAVKLKDPDCECFVAIINNYALVSLDKKKGPGGLPVGTGGRAMVLMSGGFDSPVAAFNILRRGVTTCFVHFHSIPYTSRASLEKVTDLIKVLKKYHSSGILYCVPFADAQKEIVMKCPESLRVILYRRLMLKVAQELAKREKSLALVTGDSIGQVASQTLENIFAVSQVCGMPIFRPLIGTDKEDIMDIAKKIGTYDISKLAHDDCCTRLMPKKPELRAKLPKVLEAEKALDIPKMISEILAGVEKIKI
ncbi:MAG: tRNA 4-thiouridine(8) synthase ThiI, partial [Candidatus Moranbacteria bacterium]|nr:tRNA 4-thiouridine(8) synthase ThiI [Candidatus Moranbacteria bacterium]